MSNTKFTFDTDITLTLRITASYDIGGGGHYSWGYPNGLPPDPPECCIHEAIVLLPPARDGTQHGFSVIDEAALAQHLDDLIHDASVAYAESDEGADL